MVFLSLGAGRKPTVRAAGIVIAELVRGLNPGRARRRRTEKVPKPGNQKRLSRRIAREILSKVSSIVRATVDFGWRVARATVSISSNLVMADAPPSRQFSAISGDEKCNRSISFADIRLYSKHRAAGDLSLRNLALEPCWS